MDKFKLVDGTEYEVTNSVASDDTLQLTVITNDFPTLKQTLTKDNLKEVELYTNGNLSGMYKDFINMSPFLIDGDEVTFSLRKEDEVQVRLNELEETNAENETLIANLLSEVEEVNETNAVLFDTILTEVIPSILGLITIQE